MLREAIRRYDLFLALLADLTAQKDDVPDLAVPVDIAWLWHCHKLSPIQYSKDCGVRTNVTSSRGACDIQATAVNCLSTRPEIISP